MPTILVLFYLAVAASKPDIASYRPLFSIERSTNANVVHYEARVTEDGKLDPADPVAVYWIMVAEDGRRQELNYLEKSRAYGFTVKCDPSDRSCNMALVSQKDRPIRIYLEGDTARAETLIGGHRAYLTRIYISTRRVLLIRTIDYIELFGVDVTSRENCYEKVLPTR